MLDSLANAGHLARAPVSRKPWRRGEKMASTRLRPIPILAALLLLAGCWAPDWKLIDQRNFWPAGTPGASDVARANLPKLPLLTIDFDDLDANFRPALDDAVVAAQARKPDVEFDVLTPMPTTAPQQQQDEFARQGADDAQQIAAALIDDGVPPDRVHIGLRGDPGSPPREVRVYVR
jgi:hypothetical protein